MNSEGKRSNNEVMTGQKSDSSKLGAHNKRRNFNSLKRFKGSLFPTHVYEELCPAHTPLYFCCCCGGCSYCCCRCCCCRVFVVNISSVDILALFILFLAFFPDFLSFITSFAFLADNRYLSVHTPTKTTTYGRNHAYPVRQYIK